MYHNRVYCVSLIAEIVVYVVAELIVAFQEADRVFLRGCVVVGEARDLHAGKGIVKWPGLAKQQW